MQNPVETQTYNIELTKTGRSYSPVHTWAGGETSMKYPMVSEENL